MLAKYCEYMAGTRSQKKRAILLQLSTLIKDEGVVENDRCQDADIKEKSGVPGNSGSAHVVVLDNLLAAKMFGLAGRFLYVCQTQLKVKLV